MALFVVVLAPSAAWTHIKGFTPPISLRSGATASVMQAGDLFNGEDPERNALLEKLKRSFYTGMQEEAPMQETQLDSTRIGLYLDIPMTRWSFNALPHHRSALNVWQPQYTLMFEKLLAGPQPWLYFHVLLPGGVDNLDNPEYALEPGSKADLTGTIMQVVAVQRESDSRLTMLVQGLCRGIVVRSTQTLPYARGDVQVLPDEEMLIENARRARRYINTMGSEERVRATDGLEPHLVMAAAQAEELHWRAYEHANLTLSVHQTLSQVNASLAMPAAKTEADTIQTGLTAEAEAPFRRDSDRAALGEGSIGNGEEEEDLFTSCTPVSVAIASAIDAANSLSDALLVDEEEAAARLERMAANINVEEEELVAVEAELAEAEMEEEAAEQARALLTLEHMVWLELDELLRALARARAPSGTAPVPSQLLGLLPPPPEGGWPEEFETGLGDSATQIHERYMNAIAEGEELSVARFYSYIPIDHDHYPARRRAQRLSYAIWAVIGGQGVDLQPLLDEQSTSDRLRLALLRCRDVMKQLS